MGRLLSAETPAGVSRLADDRLRLFDDDFSDRIHQQRCDREHSDANSCRPVQCFADRPSDDNDSSRFGDKLCLHVADCDASECDCVWFGKNLRPPDGPLWSFVEFSGCRIGAILG